MTTVFIAGSISISRLHVVVKERIAKVVDSGLDVVVGDADGADTSIQSLLAECEARKVVVYCSGDVPRNNIGEWPIHNVYPNSSPGTRAFFTAKDLEMAKTSEFGLMIWDCKSTGTLSNVIELIKQGKKSVVFVNKNKHFVNVSSLPDLQHLLEFMSDHARKKAEDKINLTSKIVSLQSHQWSLAI